MGKRNFLFLILLLLVGGCSAPLARRVTPSTNTPTILIQTPSALPSPTNTPEITATKTNIPATPTATLSPIPTEIVPAAAPVINLPCEDLICYQTFSGVLSIPIPEEFTQTVDPTYRYGTTQLGERVPHVGVEFYNPFGTPVLASADGIVIFVGNDQDQVWGAYPGFYGNLIIIKHEISGMAEPLYTLYAHLSESETQERDTVSAGQQIGKVGASGSAIGSHLHFEIRYGNPAANNTLNPELFLKLVVSQSDEKTGILIGSITDHQQLVTSQNLVIQKIIDENIQPNSSIFIETYARDLPSSSEYQENFIISNLPVGQYRISSFIEGTLFEEVFFIKEQTKTIININSED